MVGSEIMLMWKSLVLEKNRKADNIAQSEKLIKITEYLSNNCLSI